MSTLLLPPVDLEKTTREDGTEFVTLTVGASRQVLTMGEWSKLISTPRLILEGKAA